MPIIESGNVSYQSVNRAFSKQAVTYDIEDRQNIVLQDMRKQVYDHVANFIKPNSDMLELNAGTGIDALHFVQQGHHVHATDLSDGMIQQLGQKIKNYALQNQFTCQQLSYDQLDKLAKKFDYVFSNFGGLNCIEDLSAVTKHLPSILKPGAYITWVIMPKLCPWEILSLLKGHKNQALRRFKKKGVLAHLEGEYFKTYYFSLAQIVNAFGAQFKLVKSEGLCSVSPPPAQNQFPIKHPVLYRSLRKVDSIVRFNYPFNRWADHIIVTFQYLQNQKNT